MNEQKDARASSSTKVRDDVPSKIELDAMEREKKTSFANLGRNSSGISITFSGSPGDGEKSVPSVRRGSGKELLALSGSCSSTPAKARGFSPGNCDQEDINSQLNAVKLKLEERRKKIEDEKKKMEVLMAKQREKVGQEAFLRAVAKGIKKAGGGQQGELPETARTEILELATKVVQQDKGAEGGAAVVRRPFSLKFQQDYNNPKDAVKTPQEAAMDISRMSDSLYELQSDIQRLALQQTQIQNMMNSASASSSFSANRKSTSGDTKPFYISTPPEVTANGKQQPLQPFYISQHPDPTPPPAAQPPQHPPYVRRTWSQPQPIQFPAYQEPAPPLAPIGYGQPPYMHHPPPHPPGHPPHHHHQQQYDQYGRPLMDQWGHPMSLPPHQPPLYSSYQQYGQQEAGQPYPPAGAAPYAAYQQQAHYGGGPHHHHLANYAPYRSGGRRDAEEEQHQQLDYVGQGGGHIVSPPYRAALSRTSSLKNSRSRNSSLNRSQPASTSANQEQEPPVTDSRLNRSDPTGEVPSGHNYRRHEEDGAQFFYSDRDRDEVDSPRPGDDRLPRKPATPQKPSLSASFLEQKRRLLEQHQPGRPYSAGAADTARNSSDVGIQGTQESTRTPTPPSCIEPSLTRSTLETLNTMTIETTGDETDNAKGFLISFSNEGPAKSKPQLKPKKQAKKPSEEVTTPSEPVVPDSISCVLCSVSTVYEAAARLCPDCLQLVERAREGRLSAGACSTLEACEASPLGGRCEACQLEAVVSAGLLAADGRSAEEFQVVVVTEPGPVDGGPDDKKKDWVTMMTLKRRQQAEENRIKREEEAAKRREQEEQKKEELLRKKEEEKRRREDILEQYKIKKEMERAEREGDGFLVSKSAAPKLRPRSAGGMKPRPKTIHVDGNDADLASMGSSRGMRGSQSNLNVNGGGGGAAAYRTTGRLPGHMRRGSNVSLHEDNDMYGGTLRGLGHIGRSKSSSASNLGPGSLPLGLRLRGGKDFDDGASDVSLSSTTSGYRSGRVSAKLFREPVAKSNRPIVMNAVEYVVFPGAVNKETRSRVLEEIERCDCPHFLILFRDSKLQFRGLYAYYPDTEEVFKIYGAGPKQITDNMMEQYYKYNSGGKKFTQIHTKHLTVTIDAFTIHNSLWLGKKAKLPEKNMALII